MVDWDRDRLIDALAAIAQPTRLDVCRLLARQAPHARAAGDIARLLAVPQNTLSSHLALLERAGLLASRREGRHVLYATRPQAFAVLSDMMAACAGEHGPALPARRDPVGSDRPLNVLILCTANSARSIMAEALMAREGRGRVRVWSAGSRPRGAVDPEARALLASLGFDTGGLASRSWADFSGPAAPRLDVVVTVCDQAAGEVCPTFIGEPIAVHWGLADPLAVTGPLEARRAAIRQAYRDLAARVSAFLALGFETMERADLAAALAAIGRMEGATALTLARAA